MPSSAADGTWEEHNLLQVYGSLAVYDQAGDRLLSIGGQRREGWALPLAGRNTWQPLPGPVENLSPWTSAVDPSTGLVYYLYLSEAAGGLVIHTLDPLTGAVTVVAAPRLPFLPIPGGMIFDPVNHRLMVCGSSVFDYGDVQVWALDLLPTPTWSQWKPSGTALLSIPNFPIPAVLDPVRRRMVFPTGIPSDYGAGPLSIWALTLDGPPQWLHFQTNGLPDGTPYGGNPMVYDPAGDRLVTIGGQGELYVLSPETFQWSRATSHAPGPSPRSGAGIAIDAVQHRLLVCGGATPSFDDAHSDAWVLSLDRASVWRKLVPDAMRAPFRSGASDGYDASRRRLVVFGGSDDRGGFRNDTWTVDLPAAPEWSPLATRGTAPPGRFWHVSAWDPVRDQLIVFGGFNGDLYHPLGDLWALSFSPGQPTWSQITPSGSAPASRTLSQLVYDSARDRFLLVFGYDGVNVLHDVWELRLSPTPGWRQLSPAGTQPPARAGHMCVYDPLRDRVLVFGGGTSKGSLNDLWALSLGSGDGSWQPLPAAPAPSERNLGLLRLDTTRDRLILFGGYGVSHREGNSTSIDMLDDTWALDLAGTLSWRQLSPAGFQPPARNAANGAYDPQNDRLVLACGLNGSNDLWTLAFQEPPAAGRLEPAGVTPGGAGSSSGTGRMQIPQPALALSARAAGTRVSFTVQLSGGEAATLALFDLAGRSVWSMRVGHLGTGTHEVSMSGETLPPAVYFARLTQGRAMRHARVALVR